MPNSTRSSSASADCRPHSGAPATRAGFRRTAAPGARIEWRPSRCLLAAMLLLGAFAAGSVLASEMPRPLAWPLSAVAAGYGLWLFRRERRRPALSLVLGGDPFRAEVDGEPVDGFDLQWRGPLAYASWRDRDGRRRRLAWWPDTLAPARRRELRLAVPAARAARQGTSMAP